MEKIKLGIRQELKIIQEESFGVYLGDSEEKVLLPIKQVPEGSKIGDILNVFIYKDSEDRPVATMSEPKITLGEIAVLKVKQVTKIGVFMDWGLEKDLLLPYSEQTERVKEGLFYPVALYEDKSGRLALTMWTDKFLKSRDMDEKAKARALLKMQADAENVFVQISNKGGSLDYDDKADAEIIKKDFGLSKNAFKKAVGILYKAGRINLSQGSISVR